MPEPCDICGGVGADGHDGTIVKNDRGSPITACEDCFDRLRTPRCRLCGEEIRRDKAVFIYFTAEEGGEQDTHDVCANCRNAIQRGGGVSHDG